MQDVFLRAWEGVARFEVGRGKVSSWLLAIAHNRAIDELRTRRNRSDRLVTSYNQATPAEQEQALRARSSVGGLDEMNEPEEMVLDGIRRAQVLAALGQLPPEQRKVIALAYYGGKSHREIAEQLEQPLGTIKTRMRLGLQKLHNLLPQE